MHRFSPRRLAAAATGLCFVLLALVPAMAVGAQTYPYPSQAYPYPYTTAPAPATPALTPPVIGGATTTQAPTLPAPAVPAAPVTTTGYPPNAVISSYFDPRYCGNGAVSVVTDGSGNLINICTSTGQRVIPVYPDFAPAPFAAPAVAPTTYSYGYFGTGASNGYTYGYTPYAVNTAYGYPLTTGTREYTDNNSNCPNGDVTQTPSGFFCTANGLPAFSVR